MNDHPGTQLIMPHACNAPIRGHIDRCILFFVMTILLLLPCISFASQNSCENSPGRRFSTALIIASAQEYAVGRKMQILEDPSCELTFEQVSSGRYETQFRHVTREVPNFGFSRSAWWLRIRIHFADTVETQQWVLKYRWPFVSRISAYIANDGRTFRSIETGVDRPRENRDLPDRLFMFALEPGPGATATVYLRVINGGILILPLSVMPERLMHEQNRREYLLYGLFLGLLTSMIFYQLLLFFSVHDPNYILYALFILFQFIYHAINQGIAAWALGISGPAVNAATVIGASMIALLVLFFSQPVLCPRRGTRTVYGMFFAFETFFALYIPAALALPSVFTWNVFFLFTLITALFLISLAVVKLLEGSGTSCWLLVFLLIFLGTALVTIVLRFDLVPYSPLIENIRSVAIAIESVLLAYITHAQIRGLERQRIQAKSALITALEESARMKDEFLATSSRELRTPLHGIVGLCEVLRLKYDKRDTFDCREELQLIDHSAQRLLGQIGNLLDISRLRDTQRPPQLTPEVLSLREQLMYVCSLLTPLTEGRALELRNSVGPETPCVYSDKQSLHQILIHLITDALRRTEFGVIEIRAAESENGGVSITVSNTGALAVSGDYGDTLDLSLVKKLVDLQGGSIRCSAPGARGASITVTLPGPPAGVTRDTRAVADGAPPPLQEEAVRGRPHPVPAGPVPHILVVDEDPVSVTILRQFFESKGYDAQFSAGARDALSRLRQGRGIRLLIADLVMSEMPGLEFLRRVRREHSAGDLPLIVTSANSRLDDLRAAYAAGASDYLIKPFHVDELSQRIDGFFARMNIIEPAVGGILAGGAAGGEILRYRDIVCLEALGKRCAVHLADRTVIISRLLKNLEQHLPDFFMRIHRGHSINLHYLEKIIARDRWSHEALVRCSPPRRIPVGRGYVRELRARFDGRSAKR